MEKYRLKQKIENGNIISLSNENMTNVLIYSILTFLAIAIYLCLNNTKLTGQVIIAYICLGLLSSLIFYNLIYGGTVRLVKNKIYINKTIGKKFQIDLDDIVEISSTNVGKIKLTSIKYPFEDNTDKVVFINSRKSFEGFYINPTELINLAKSIYSK